MLPRPTIRKLLRDAFASDDYELDEIRDGLTVPAKKQLRWLTDLADKLSKLNRVQAKVHDFYVALKVLPPDLNHRNLEWFMLNFFPYDGLAVKTNRTGLWLADATYRRRRKAETEIAVRDIEHLVPFIESVKAQQDRAALRAERNTKVTNLKQRGLKSQLIELGAKHGFSFSLGESKRDVNLSIRVCGRKSAYHIAFPKGKLDAVLEQVPDLIKTLEELRTLGITFRSNNKRWADKQSDWIEPKSTTKA